VTRLIEEEDEARLVRWLSEEAGIDEAVARRVASAFLPDGHCRLGLRAIKKIMPA